MIGVPCRLKRCSRSCHWRCILGTICHCDMLQDETSCPSIHPHARCWRPASPTAATCQELEVLIQAPLWDAAQLTTPAALTVFMCQEAAA